jgi:hypothetical protein
MDFTFTDDQLTFREAMSRFLMTEAAPEMLREIWETDSGRSPELRGKLAEQGLTALSVPEDCGGLGMDDVAWALMTQELGYYAIPDSLADTAYVSAGLLKALPAGSPGARPGWRIADGSVRIAVGHPVNPLVADAHTADLLLLPHGDEVHLVPRALVDVTANASIDLSRRLASVSLGAQLRHPLAEGRGRAPPVGAALDRGHPVGGRPAARSGPAHARPVGRLRRPAQAVRQADRQLPGGQAPPGRRGDPHRVRQAGALPRRPRPGPRRPGCERRVRTPSWPAARPPGWPPATAFRCMAPWATRGKSICRCS